MNDIPEAGDNKPKVARLVSILYPIRECKKIVILRQVSYKT